MFVYLLLQRGMLKDLLKLFWLLYSSVTENRQGEIKDMNQKLYFSHVIDEKSSYINGKEPTHGHVESPWQWAGDGLQICKVIVEFSHKTIFSLASVFNLDMYSNIWMCIQSLSRVIFPSRLHPFAQQAWLPFLREELPSPIPSHTHSFLLIFSKESCCTPLNLPGLTISQISGW